MWCIRQPFVMEAALPGGELAEGGSENGYAALVALTTGRRKVFWCDGQIYQAESFCACFPTVNRLLRVTVGLHHIVTK